MHLLVMGKTRGLPAAGTDQSGNPSNHEGSSDRNSEIEPEGTGGARGDLLRTTAGAAMALGHVRLAPDRISNKPPERTCNAPFT